MSARSGRQKRVLEFMVRYYCTRKHRLPELCPDCASLLAYAVRRLEHCRYGDAKPACSRCATHCYRSEERQRIRELMRYSGPRMLFAMPLEALVHAFAATGDSEKRQGKA